jgi:predicted secreted protein
MLPEPMHGAEAATEYLLQIAPFIAHTEILEIIIDRNSAAVRVLIHSINGVEVEGAFFFRIYQGQISRVRSLFDTRTLLAGSSG